MKRLLILVLISCLMSGCSIYSQISEQTNDPIILANALYAEALGAYKEAAISFRDNKLLLENSNHEAAATAQRTLQSAYDILKKWREYKDIGDLGSMNDAEFRQKIKLVLLLIAQEIDKE